VLLTNGVAAVELAVFCYHRNRHVPKISQDAARHELLKSSLLKKNIFLSKFTYRLEPLYETGTYLSLAKMPRGANCSAFLLFKRIYEPSKVTTQIAQKFCIIVAFYGIYTRALTFEKLYSDTLGVSHLMKCFSIFFFSTDF
jgi:hypothetical protein